MVACNLWLMDSPEMVLDYALKGGKIVLITEENDPRLEYIPSKLSAKILLPPFDAVNAELDNNLPLANAIYCSYLSEKEPADYISVLTAAAMQGVMIGIYFGPELRDMRWPMMFLSYLYNVRGIQVGSSNVQPGIADHAMATNVCDLYIKGLMSLPDFIMKYPIGIDIPMEIVRILAVNYNMPYHMMGDDLNGFFKDLIKESQEHGHYLRSPFVTVEGIET